MPASQKAVSFHWSVSHSVHDQNDKGIESLCATLRIPRAIPKPKLVVVHPAV